MNEIINLKWKKVQTDEEAYQMLKKEKDKGLIDPEEWKRLRLRILKKEGKTWSE